MGDKSEIQWTDATWNPVVGCSHVSHGCDNCYAEMLHKTRLEGVGVYPSYRPWTAENAEHNVTLAPERLDQPLRWKKPRMVFVNSMSDLFHRKVPDEYIARVFAVMALAPRHTFQILTKRPERMAFILSGSVFERTVLEQIEKLGKDWPTPDLPPRSPLPNVWLGTSIESDEFIGRADSLRRTPAAVRFISAEPLLGPLVHMCDCDYWPPREGSPREHAADCATARPGLDMEGLDWLIVGGESGPGHRPIEERWVWDLMNMAKYRRAAFFFKQWGGYTPKAGGRELMGRTWDEMPV